MGRPACVGCGIILFFITVKLCFDRFMNTQRLLNENKNIKLRAMEELLKEIKQYRKEQQELCEFSKKNGHPKTAAFDEGGLNACDKIIAIIERVLADSSNDSSGLNIAGVSNNEALESSSEGMTVCEHEWTTNEESDIPFALKCIKCGIDG